MSIQKLINKLITQSRQATTEELAGLVERVSTAPFTEDLLEVDASLWGGFWQGDVIAPGYRLPAIELALLRATRLDWTWPEGTGVAQFLADLHGAVADPQAGIWTLFAANEPCLVFASVRGQGIGVGGWEEESGGRRSQGEASHSAVGGPILATVVWYCATTERLHAGYRTPSNRLNFAGAVKQRDFDFSGIAPFENVSYQDNRLNWLEQGITTEQAKTHGGRRSIVRSLTLAARLDAEILQRRHIE